MTAVERAILDKLNAAAVSVYKAVGFAILVLILLGLAGYLAVQGFFVVSHSWVAPIVVTPSDPRVLELSAELAQHSAARSKLFAERSELLHRLKDAMRATSAQRTFQERFKRALRVDHQARSRELASLMQLRQQYAATREEIVASNRAYAGMARTRADALLSAGLLEREGYLTTNHQLADMAHSNLVLAQAEVQIEGQVGVLQREVRGLARAKALLASGHDGAGAEGLGSHDLLLQQEYTHSMLELASADDTQEALLKGLASLDEAMSRYDRLLAAIRSSPYFKGVEGNFAVAFVPYQNLGRARLGARLLHCAAGVLLCREVGRVGPALEGEVTQKHPIRQQVLRGVMVEVVLQDPRWARESLLHIGRPLPLP